MPKNTEIAERLKKFGQSKFGSRHGWKKRFADALGVTSQHLDRYLSAASDPGNKMYMRLIQLNCDIQWLLTGNPSTAQDRITEQEKEILNELRKAGIDTAEKAQYLLFPEQLASDIAATIVKEIRTKYRTKKNRNRKKN